MTGASTADELNAIDAEWRSRCRDDELVSRGPQPPDGSELSGVLLRSLDAPIGEMNRALESEARGLTGEEVSVQEALRQLFLLGETLGGHVGSEGAEGLVRGVGLAAETIASIYLSSAEEAARTDVLTGLPNRRVLELDIVGAIRRTSTESGSVVLAAIDLDGLKVANDEFGGHVAGDHYIQRFAAELVDAVRTANGRVYRWHGDEYFVLFRDKTGDEAKDVLDGLRRRPDVAPFCYGLAVCPDEDDDPSRLQSIADGKLYEMKGERSKAERDQTAREWLDSDSWDYVPAEASDGA